ncbi:hypothetical protein [Actinomadura oligospora]|uniref:hypothetical protein n=1 Tax=Actinomadura oligospora TaxID=111804 RepID=UPI0012F7ADF4|nr:hypothetical protein [Actinomadura oligospora]
MLRLNTGWPRSLWIVQLGCTLPVLVLCELMLTLIATMFLNAGGGMSIFGVFALVFAVGSISAFAAVLAWRYGQAFWLDGRVLIRRSVTGRKHFDLSQAQVRAESIAPSMAARPMPRLVVEVPGGARVKMWLREPTRRGALLPPEQLVALARAIDPSLQHPLARRLYELASDPLGGVS